MFFSGGLVIYCSWPRWGRQIKLENAMTTKTGKMSFWLFAIVKLPASTRPATEDHQTKRCDVVSRKQSPPGKRHWASIFDKLLFRFIESLLQSEFVLLIFSWGKDAQAIMNCAFSTKHNSHFVYSELLPTAHCLPSSFNSPLEGSMDFLGGGCL